MVNRTERSLKKKSISGLTKFHSDKVVYQIIFTDWKFIFGDWLLNDDIFPEQLLIFLALLVALLSFYFYSRGEKELI